MESLTTIPLELVADLDEKEGHGHGQHDSQTPPGKNEPKTVATRTDVDEEAASNPPSSSSTEHTEPQVDGTLWGWLCVLGGFLGLVGSFGFIQACGLFQEYYESHLLASYSHSEISWIISTQIFLMFLSGVFWGRLIDAYGPRYILLLSSFLCVFSLCMLSLSTQYYQIFLCQSVLFGFGAGGIVFASTVVTNHWFHRRRGLALGIVVSGSCFGGVIFPIFLSSLLDKYGFSASCRYCALFVGLCLFTTCLLVHPRLQPKGWDRTASWFDFAAFKEPPFTLFCMGSFFIMLGMFAPFNYLPLMATTRAGFSRKMSLYTISIINAGNTPGRILPSYLADFTGRFNIVCLAATTSGVAVLAFWLPLEFYPSHTGILVFGCLFGFLSGATVSLQSPCMAELSIKAGKMHHFGQRTGVYFGVLSFGSLAGLPIMGQLITACDGAFTGLMIYCGICLMIGGFFIGAARVAHGGPGVWKKV